MFNVFSWQRAENAPVAVKTFVFSHKAMDDGPIEVAKQNVQLSTPQQRYNEAMRLLKPICSELSDVDDPDEFRSFVEFLLAQFRNMRQRKRVTVVSASEDDEDPVSPPSVPLELSQANSLYSADVGDVPAPCLASLRIPQTADLVCNGGTTAAAQSKHASRSEGDLAQNPGLDLGETQQGAEHERLGPGSGRPGYQPGHRHVDAHEDKEARDAASTDVMDLDVGSADEKMDKDAVSDEDMDGSIDNAFDDKYQIRINKGVKKSGRPKKNKAEEAAAERQARVLFNASEKARRARRELTMEDVVRGIEADQPSVEETRKRVAGIPERFQDRVNSKPKYHRLPNPTLNQDIFYILPPKLLSACFSKLKVSNTHDDAIMVGTPSEQGSRRSSRHSSNGHGDAGRADLTDAQLVDVVSVAHVGMFSREQIELMRRVEVLKTRCAEGTKFVTWVKQTLASKVPAALQKQVKDLATTVESMFPPGPLPGLKERPEFHVAALYRLQPPSWLDDGIIFAFCERLAQVSDGLQCPGVGRHGRVLRKSVILPDPIPAMLKLALEGAKHIVLPVNFDDKHWTGVYVNVPAKTISFYDPLNLDIYRSRLNGIVARMVDGNNAPFVNYTAVDVQNPIQADGYSCGLFVCYKFWRLADSSVSKDMSPHGLFTRRFEFIHFVLHGTKVT
jgi:hypothetical protein